MRESSLSVRAVGTVAGKGCALMCVLKLMSLAISLIEVFVGSVTELLLFLI